MKDNRRRRGRGGCDCTTPSPLDTLIPREGGEKRVGPMADETWRVAVSPEIG